MYPETFQCATQIEDSDFIDDQILIFIVSDPRCGYSQRALKQIGEFAAKKGHIQVIAADVSGKAEEIRRHEKLQFYNLNSILLIDATSCGEDFRELIPKIYVYDKSKMTLIWMRNGWGKNDIKKLGKKIEKYF